MVKQARAVLQTEVIKDFQQISNLGFIYSQLVHAYAGQRNCSNQTKSFECSSGSDPAPTAGWIWKREVCFGDSFWGLCLNQVQTHLSGPVRGQIKQAGVLNHDWIRMGRHKQQQTRKPSQKRQCVMCFRSIIANK